MTRTTNPPVLILLALLASCASVTKPPSAGGSLAVGNTYVFRGVAQATEGVLQGDMHMAVTDDDGGTYSVTGWANMNLSSEGDNGVFPADREHKVTEFDLVPQYSRTVDAWTLAGGLVSLNFPNGVGVSTTEAFVAAGYDTLLSPKLTVSYDFEEVEGIYVNAAVSHGIELDDKWKLELGASLGLANDRMGAFYWYSRSSGLADLVGHVSASYQLTPHAALTAGVYASSILGSKYRDALDAAGLDSDNLWALVGVAWSF